MSLKKISALSLTLVLLSTAQAYGDSRTPASAITHAPVSMKGINTQHKFFSGGLDPKIVTLGPTEGTHPELGYYEGKNGDNYEVAFGAPILAPLDSKFIGFNNRNSNFRNGMEGKIQIPFDDLQLCFESTSKDWPKLIYCYYHLKNSPLLLGINKNKECSNSEEWPGPFRGEGILIYTDNDQNIKSTPISKSCQALLGKKLKRGDVVGYAGRVETHSQAPIMVKVYDKKISKIVKKGNKNLHWVQPDVFFYWKCFNPKASFEPGVLAYPFQCEGFRVPQSQQSINYKYKK